MAVNFGGSRVQQVSFPQSQAPQLKLAGARALAEGIQEAGRAIAQGIIRAKDLAAKQAAQQAELQFRQQQAARDLQAQNLQLIKETGRKLVPGPTPGSFDTVDASEEQRKMLEAESRNQVALAKERRKQEAPVTEQMVNDLAAAMRTLGISDLPQEEVPLGAEFGGTQTFDPLVPTARALLESPSAVTSFLGNRLTQEAISGRAAEKEKGLSARAAATLESRQTLQNQKLAFETAQTDKKFERDMIKLGYEFDQKRELLQLGEESKKRLIEWSDKFDEADQKIAAALIADLDANPFGLMSANRARAAAGLKPFDSIQEYLDDRMKLIKGAAKAQGGLSPEEEKRLQELIPKK